MQPVNIFATSLRLWLRAQDTGEFKKTLQFVTPIKTYDRPKCRHGLHDSVIPRNYSFHKEFTVWSHACFSNTSTILIINIHLWFMVTRDVLKVLKIARAVGEYNLRTFKTPRVTINHEMHEQVYTTLYLLYSQQNYSNALLCSFSYSSSFGFSFLSVAHVCQTFNQGLCSFQRVFVFCIFFKLLNDVLVSQSKPTVSHFFFHFGVQIWRFPGVSIATSVLHITWIALYNLFMHSPLANQN